MRYGRVWLVVFLGVMAVIGGMRLVSQPNGSPTILTAGIAPARIISVNVMSDEILMALAPERLIALSTLADNPDSSNIVKETAVVPMRITDDSEHIVMMAPDVVFIGGHHADVVRQIEGLGIRVFAIRGFESFEWIRSQIRLMGAVVGVPERAECLVKDMNARIEAIAARVAGQPRPRVLLYSESSWVYGRNTTLDDILTAAGGVNLASEMGIVGSRHVSQESVVLADPDVILLRDSRSWESGFRQALLNNPAFQGVKALRTQRVYSIPSRLLVTSSHHVADSIEAIARLLHPQVFTGSS